MSKELTRREFIKGSATLGGGFVLFGKEMLRPKKVHAQQDQTVDLPEKTPDTNPAKELPDYDSLRIRTLQEDKYTAEELPVLLAEHQKTLEWAKKMLVKVDELLTQNPNTPERFKNASRDLINYGTNLDLSEREFVIPFLTPSFKWDEVSKNPNGIYPVTAFDIGPSTTPSKIAHLLNFRSAALPSRDKNQYNDPDQSVYPIFMFLYTMNLFHKYHQKATETESFDRDQFLADFYTDEKRIFAMAEGLDEVVELFDQSGKQDRLFTLLSKERQRIKSNFPEDQYWFEWRKLINKLFLGNRVTEDLLK